jgi:ADP-ribose pyrophosphatase YjhB (NUDIX family)
MREVLLMQLEVAPHRLVWVAPGGGLENGESPSEGAIREVFEETGVRIEPGVAVWRRTHTFEFQGRPLRQCETYFLVRVARFEPRTDNLQPAEQRFIRRFCWWDIDSIPASDELFAPTKLGNLLIDLLRDGPPVAPIDVGI